MLLRFSIFGNPYHFTFKFLSLTTVLVLLFCYLGLWQYHRAEQKRILIEQYEHRPHEKPIDFEKLFVKAQDPRFYAIQLKGKFDNQHHILLDNRTHEGQVGYEVYTPFLVAGTDKGILIDRGWVPANRSRAILPDIQPVEATLTLRGVVNTAPTYFSLGPMTDSLASPFPLRVQYLKLAELSPLLGYTLAPYLVWLDPKDSHGFERQFKVTFMGPEKHLMYTVQWFAFALSLLVLFVVLNLHRGPAPKNEK